MFRLSNIKRLFLNGGVDETSYGKIKGKIQESNRGTLLIFSTVAVIVYLALTIANFAVETMSSYRGAYVSGLVVSAVILFVAQFPGKTSRTAITIDMYCFALLLLCTGIVMGTVMGPNELAATYIALLLAVPQMFTDRPWRMHLLIVLSDVIFIVMVNRFKNPVTVDADIINCVVFGILSIALSAFSISNRVQRYALENEIRFLAENDQLTGLKNRYCYQQVLDGINMEMSDSIYCVYADANGLHELNDSKGHEAGDKMLQFIALVMKDTFGEDNVYRIGGDEFVAIGKDKTAGDINSMVSGMKKTIEASGYHVAVGIGTKDSAEIKADSVVKKAEKAMYKDKAAYYAQQGHDRRSR